MGDYIANKQSWFTICPKCKNHTLKVTTWEEHLQGWGFDSYRVEEYIKCYCSVCEKSFSYNKVQEAEARHIKRNTHQRQYKRTVKRGKKRKAKRERLRADRRNWDINKFLDDDIDDLPF